MTSEWMDQDEVLAIAAAAAGDFERGKRRILRELRAWKIATWADDIRQNKDDGRKLLLYQDTALTCQFWTEADAQSWDTDMDCAVYTGGNLDFLGIEVQGIKFKRSDVDIIWGARKLSSISGDQNSAPIAAANTDDQTIVQAKRGPKPQVMPRVISEMEKLAPAELERMPEEAMAATFGASRDTCRRARRQVLSKIVDI